MATLAINGKNEQSIKFVINNTVEISPSKFRNIMKILLEIIKNI